MGAWLNIIMTRELCWKGRDVQFQSLFSSVFLFFIQWWSEVKCTNSSGHMAQELSFSKSKVGSLTTVWQSQSVLLVHSCLYHSAASPRVRTVCYASCWVIAAFPGLKTRSPASWTSAFIVRLVSKSSSLDTGIWSSKSSTWFHSLKCSFAEISKFIYKVSFKYISFGI